MSSQHTIMPLNGLPNAQSYQFGVVSKHSATPFLGCPCLAFQNKWSLSVNLKLKVGWYPQLFCLTISLSGIFQVLTISKMVLSFYVTCFIPPKVPWSGTSTSQDSKSCTVDEIDQIEVRIVRLLLGIQQCIQVYIIGEAYTALLGYASLALSEL